MQVIGVGAYVEIDPRKVATSIAHDLLIHLGDGPYRGIVSNTFESSYVGLVATVRLPGANAVTVAVGALSLAPAAVPDTPGSFAIRMRARRAGKVA